MRGAGAGAGSATGSATGSGSPSVASLSNAPYSGNPGMTTLVGDSKSSFYSSSSRIPSTSETTASSDHCAAFATTSTSVPKPKTPLRKDDLERIALQLKRRLSRASIAAKQSILLLPTPSSSAVSPVVPSAIDRSPFQHLLHSKPSSNSFSSPMTDLYLPNGRSPTRIRSPAPFLHLLPLKHVASSSARSSTNDESPTKRRRTSLAAKQQLVLQEMSPRPKVHALKPSLDLSSCSKPSAPTSPPPPPSDMRPAGPDAHTTPTQPKRALALHLRLNLASNPLLLTPAPPTNNPDEEGADLLMYLATSPAPPKPYNLTPRASSALDAYHSVLDSRASSALSMPTNAGVNFRSKILALAGDGPFVTPVTPKHSAQAHHSARTPVRLTPLMAFYGQNGLLSGTGLPSSGLALTPSGFNMNDYVNFFSPSPGGAMSSHVSKTLLRTPDFNAMLGHLAGSACDPDPRPKVNGKILNFNKVCYSQGNVPDQK